MTAFDFQVWINKYAKDLFGLIIYANIYLIYTHSVVENKTTKKYGERDKFLLK